MWYFDGEHALARMLFGWRGLIPGRVSAAWVGDVPRQTPHFLEAFLVIESDDEDEDDSEVKDVSDGSRDVRDVG